MAVALHLVSGGNTALRGGTATARAHASHAQGVPKNTLSRQVVSLGPS